MQDRPRRRRYRGDRRKASPQRPSPQRPERDARPARPQPEQRVARSRRPPRGSPSARGREPGDIRPGTPVVILLDAREGEPDRTGASAVFEGFFDLETGEARRGGVPRLRVGDERLWGFECWWRPDPDRSGLNEKDQLELEASKRLLRGLLRDARRSGAYRQLGAARPG